MPFDIPNLLHSPQSQALTVCALSHKLSQARLLLPGFPSLKPGFSCILRTDVVSLLKLIESIVCYPRLYMDLFGLFWLVVFCTWWFRVSVGSMGRKPLSDMHGASPVLFETGFWDLVIYIWAICAIIAILAVSMARSKNIGKGKAPGSFVERAVKKRKSDSSQPVKKGKGKQIESLESEEVSESDDDDDEIEAMFTEDSESEQEKWAHSIANRGFHCERGVKLETFLYSHPIRGIIQDQNMQFVCTEVQGYLPTVVQEFYTNMKENQRTEIVLETTVMGKQLRITPYSIAHSLQYVRLAASDRP